MRQEVYRTSRFYAGNIGWTISRSFTIFLVRVEVINVPPTFTEMDPPRQDHQSGVRAAGLHCRESCTRSEEQQQRSASRTTRVGSWTAAREHRETMQRMTGLS